MGRKFGPEYDMGIKLTQGFAVSSAISDVDRVPVLHINTEYMPEDADGPICRIYLNDEPIWENPAYPAYVDELEANDDGA